MSDPILESRLKQIEDKLAKPRRGPWEVFQLLAPLLIPASITLSGYWFSEAQSKAQAASAAQQLEIARQQAEDQKAIAQINSRVGQAQLVGTFLKPLLSENIQERKLAIQAVLIALPEDGPQFVQTISVSDTNDVVRTFALESLNQRRTDLIALVRSDDPQKSASAASDLAAGWRSDGALTKGLVESAQQTKLIPHGVENTLRVLQAQDAAALRPNRAAVEEFTQRVATNNSSTRALVEQIQLKY